MHTEDEKERSDGGGLNPKARRERSPVIRGFPYPPELIPNGPFGVYMAEGFLKEVFSFSRDGDVNVEHFGLMLGHLFSDPNRGISWLDLNYLIDTPPGIRANAVGVEVSVEQMTEMFNQIDLVKTFTGFKGEALAGWWHSHPGLGIFFSGTDKNNQKSVYGNAWQVGLVVDPLRDQWGMFKGPNADPIQPFVVPNKYLDLPGTEIFDYKSATFDPRPGLFIKAKRRW